MSTSLRTLSNGTQSFRAGVIRGAAGQQAVLVIAASTTGEQSRYIATGSLATPGQGDVEWFATFTGPGRARTASFAGIAAFSSPGVGRYNYAIRVGGATVLIQVNASAINSNLPLPVGQLRLIP